MPRRQILDMEARIARLQPLMCSVVEELDPYTKREGLAETPLRAAKALLFATGGYDEDPYELLKVFADGANSYDEMVLVKDIPFYSTCEHHLETIIGRATVGYVPNGSIVGLSKLSRVVGVFARRLQVQERMTTDIADTLMTALLPLGVGVQLRARHMCMERRGVCQQGHVTVTTALRGAMFDNPDARAEFLALAKSDAAL